MRSVRRREGGGHRLGAASCRVEVGTAPRRQRVEGGIAGGQLRVQGGERGAAGACASRRRAERAAASAARGPCAPRPAGLAPGAAAPASSRCSLRVLARLLREVGDLAAAASSIRASSRFMGRWLPRGSQASSRSLPQPTLEIDGARPAEAAPAP